MYFDRIAPYYDRLAGLVFGDVLIRSATSFFNYLRGGERILVAGGGTGEILDRLDAIGLPFKVDYIDQSAEMIRLAKERVYSNIDVDFICEDVKALDIKNAYDIIITPFLLDCFRQPELQVIVSQLASGLVQSGYWFFIDFIDSGRRTHRLLIQIMYIFFRLTAGLQARRLPDYSIAFHAADLHQRAAQRFLNGMIESRLYTRITFPKDS